jgi:hypothetical protein
LKGLRRWRCAVAFAVMGAAALAQTTVSAAEEPVPARIEARSASLLAVGLVTGDRMSIHLSRLIDNAPVHDAQVTVLLRGAAHPTTAETDGSFTLRTPDLALPGAAAVEFQINEAGARDTLKGTLQAVGREGQAEDKNSARQLWWWVLNFAVCVGFLMLISRRRKATRS